MPDAKDLTKEPPRSPRIRIRDYVILSRTIDKCRALLRGNIGEYHFDCPLDRMLFSFKEVDTDEFKQQIHQGATDDELGIWMDENGIPKTPEEIQKWSDAIEAMRPYDDPDRRAWFEEQCKPLGLDASKTTLFDWLEADDLASYRK